MIEEIVKATVKEMAFSLPTAHAQQISNGALRRIDATMSHTPDRSSGEIDPLEYSFRYLKNCSEDYLRYKR